MSSAPLPRPATLADLAGLPDNVVGEIVRGAVVTSPRPAPRHAFAASGLGMEIGPPFHRGQGGPGGWIILDEPELRLGKDVLFPDLAGWRRERMPKLPEGAAFELAPDWVCEVLSPSTAALDRIDKMPIYARERVAHVWLLDPIERLLEVFRLEADGWLRIAAHRDDAAVRAEPFEAVEIRLGGLWGA